MTTDSDLIAAYLARNTVTKCAPGERALERGEMRAAIRGETFERSDFRAERRAHDLHDTATEARMNGHRVIGTNGDRVVTNRGEY